MKVATVTENRPVFKRALDGKCAQEMTRTHKYEDSVCISLPTPSYLRVLLLGLSEVHRPEPIRRVSVVLVWYTNETTTCETGKSTYPAEPVIYSRFVVQEGSRCDVDWYLWPEAEGPR